MWMEVGGEGYVSRDFELDHRRRDCFVGTACQIQPPPLRSGGAALERLPNIVSREHLRANLGRNAFAFHQGLNHCVRSPAGFGDGA